jgi:radical SAM protein with 4Fe4S-binding SPASM domain
MDDSTNMEICTTVGCRMMCSYCPQTTLLQAYRAGSEPVRFMDMATFELCLSKLPVKVGVCFAGMAEPFLNPLCRAMILRACERGHQISLFSTLSGASVEDIKAISHIAFRHFTVHLPDADRRMKLPIDLQYLDVVQAVIERIKGFNMVVYGRVHPEVQRVLGRHIDDSSGSLISRASTLKDREIPWKAGKLRCSACGPLVDHNILMPNGDVALCCMVYDLKHVIGNLIRDSYEDLFNSDEYKRVMRGLDGDESIDIACRRCEVSVPA